MKRVLAAALTSFGIDPRGFWALTRTWILMDLRGQHYALATGQKSRHVMSPLFWVVGQCWTLSALSSFMLFARVDVCFFALVGLTLSTLLMATAFLVEFQEVIRDPRDWEVVGHRPVSARTYAAARFANLLFYFGLFFTALNLFPLMLGAGLRDAGRWYAPAYFVAALASNLTASTLVVLLLSLGGSPQLDVLKNFLAWTQIALILVVGYLGQFVLLKDRTEFLLWAASAHEEFDYLPTTWLSLFVDEAAVQPGAETLRMGLLLLGLSALVCYLMVWRVAALYRLQDSFAHAGRIRPMSVGTLGGMSKGLARWLCRSAEERVGYALGTHFLRFDGELKMRCLLPTVNGLVAAAVGYFAGQFANPLHESDAHQVIFPIGSVYLIALATPVIIRNLTFSRTHEAAWVLQLGPAERPADLARGACKAVMLRIATPICLCFGLFLGWSWGDPLAATLHAGLAWILNWPLALLSLRWLTPAPPFSLPTSLGSSLGGGVLPLAILTLGLFSLAGLHFHFARSPAFWIAIALTCPIAVWALGPTVEARFARMRRGTL